MKYLPRVLDSELDLRLRSVGATLIVGPKWCGKTTTAKQKAASGQSGYVRTDNDFLGGRESAFISSV